MSKVLRSIEEILASNTEFWQLYSVLFHTYPQADTLYIYGGIPPSFTRI